MLFTVKFISKLLEPISVCLILGVSALLFAKFGKFKWAKLSTIVALLILWLGSTLALSGVLYRGLERQYEAKGIADIPVADAIVVLGGGIGSDVSPRKFPELSRAGDRLVHGFRLLKYQKAPLILLSGGNLNDQRRAESEAMQKILELWGVDEDKILQEGSSRTTYENGIETKKIYDHHKWDSILLVTSAAHMPRAVAVYEKAGMNVIPPPTDFEVVDRKEPFYKVYLPSVEGLLLTTLAWREYLGMVYYYFRGWV